VGAWLTLTTISDTDIGWKEGIVTRDRTVQIRDLVGRDLVGAWLSLTTSVFC